MTELIKYLLWFNAIGCGLLAGVYFAFSTFIMTALGRIEAAQAISTMNSINSTILRSLFMPLFFGTTAASAVLAVAVLLRRVELGAIQMLIGGVILIAGMFLCTILFNVPLNDVLAVVDPNIADAAAAWARYLHQWTLWNHVRTISSAASCILYVSALTAK